MRILKNILIGCGLFLMAILFDFYTRRPEMSRDTRKAWRWLIIAALLVAVVRLFSGCVHPALVPIRVLKDTLNAGTTKCDSLGMIGIYLAPNLSKKDRKYVLLHEQVHVEQSNRFASCTRFINYYRSDPIIQWMIESEAYCKEYMQKVKDGVNTKVDWLWLTYGMHRYSPNSSIEELEQHLPCEEVADVTKRQSAPP